MFNVLAVMMLSALSLETTPNEDLIQFIQQSTTTSKEAPFGAESFYEKLPISLEEKQKIIQILTTLADNSVFQLIFERKHLERLGQDVQHVHPIKFLGTVFNDPRLVMCMYKIRSSMFKWGGFIDGFSARIKEEIKAGNVNLFLPGLAERLNLNVEDLQSYINRSDIEGLVFFLIDKKRR